MDRRRKAPCTYATDSEMAAQASPSEGPTSSVEASTVAAVQPDAPEPSPEPPAPAAASASTTRDPLVLVKDLIRTMMANIRLDKDQRRNAVRKWYAESGLDAANAANQATPAERSALVKAVVVELAVKVGGLMGWLGSIAPPPLLPSDVHPTPVRAPAFRTAIHCR